MKTIKFEKINGRLTKEELNFIRGGGPKVLIKQGEEKIGDSENGDTYGGGNAWQNDNGRGDTRNITYVGAVGDSGTGSGSGSAGGSGL